jgi:uroporphyrinogen-III synthase
METLIRREGGEPFMAPSVQERALDHHYEAWDFVNRLEAGEFDLVVCMTGVALAFLRDLAAAEGALERIAAGMRNTFVVARGKKWSMRSRSAKSAGSPCRNTAVRISK